MDPKGIVGMISGWFDNQINKAEESGAPGAAKKQTVIGSLLDLLGVTGILRSIIEWAVSLIIDALVSRKNDSGEFTHKSN